VYSKCNEISINTIVVAFFLIVVVVLSNGCEFPGCECFNSHQKSWAE